MPADNAYQSKYYTIFAMQQDQDLRNRITACAAGLGLLNASVTDPMFFYNVCRQPTTPGFVAAWKYATDNKNQFPGSDVGVITDAMILAAVKAQSGK